MSRLNGPLVVKLGGGLLEDAALFRVAGAVAARRHTGVIVVHGGGAEVDRQLARLGESSQRFDGLRATPVQHLDTVVGVLAGRLNTKLVGCIQGHGAPAVGLTLADGFLFRARVMSDELGRVGVLEEGDATLLRVLLAAGSVPVISSIALADDGEALNVNADDAAAAVARLVGAVELQLLTDVPGVRGTDGTIWRQLDPPMIEVAIRDGVIAGGMVPKVRGAAHAAERAGCPVRIAPWRCEVPLEAVGTCIVAGGTATVSGAGATCSGVTETPDSVWGVHTDTNTDADTGGNAGTHTDTHTGGDAENGWWPSSRTVSAAPVRSRPATLSVSARSVSALPVQVRPAVIGDAAAIERIIAWWSAAGETLPCTLASIEAAIDRFVVAVRGEAVVGCGGVVPYRADLVEIRSVGVDPDVHGGGVGSAIIRALLCQIEERYHATVFVLTRAPGFFIRLGFEAIELEELPEKVFRDCELCPRRDCCDEIAMVYRGEAIV